MLKLILALALVVCFIGPVCADNVFDDLTDTLKGRNENLPFDLYVAKTISLEEIPYANILNADLRIKLSTPFGEKFFNEGRLQAGLEF